jgi:lysophospholipase L1-like esterase
MPASTLRWAAEVDNAAAMAGEPEGLKGARQPRWLRLVRDGHPVAFAVVLIAALAAGIVGKVNYRGASVYVLSPPFARDGEFGWRARLPDAVAGVGQLYGVRFAEEDTVLQKGVTPEQLPAIEQDGGGLYTRIGQEFVFSTPDDSNPNKNGRRYRLLVYVRRLSWRLLMIAAASVIGLAVLYCSRRRRQTTAVAVAVGLGGLGLASATFATNVLLVLGLSAGATAGVYLAIHIFGLLLPARWQPRIDAVAANSTLLAGSAALVLVCGEALLCALGPGASAALQLPPTPPAVVSRSIPAEPTDKTVAVNLPSLAQAQELIDPNVLAEAHRRESAIVMAPEWQLRSVTIPQAYAAKYWQGALQVSNSDWMRRVGRIPPKDPAVFRILVLGDSLTYGIGIADQYTYSRQLERLLRDRWRIETINAGVPGAQSEDIAVQAQRLVPRLQPDLLIYGVCQNDFLPSGVAQYDGSFKLFSLLRARTRLGPVAEQGISRALIGLGLRRDFFDDILYGIIAYRERFARDVAAINRTATAAGLPPVVALVLDQYPRDQGRGHEITRIAERALTAVGATVISTDDYYRRFDGWVMRVSVWEGHPDETANAIWALMLAQIVEKDPRLAHYAPPEH